MHEITDLRDLRAPLQVQRVHTPSSAANIRIINRSDSLPNASSKTKLRTTSTPVKTIITRRNTAPAVTSQHLAHRFRQNWLAKFPMDTCSNGSMNLDDSLTSLNWLQNLNIMKMASPAAPAPVQTIPFTKDSKVNPNAVLNVVTTPAVKYDQRYPMETRIVSPPVSSYDKIDYKTNHTVKPPYSYATLICMAMQETKQQKITLSSIYNWITDNFVYYRMAEPSWQNSIRHNLSLNKCFQKVARRKDEPGKGGFWRINPEYVDSFENGVFKKRRCSNERFVSVGAMPPLKRIKREFDEDIFSQSQDSCGSKENTSNPFMNFNMVQSDDEGETFSGEINWSNILSQDISIEGKTLKTEDLLNETEALASPLMEMSPPPSESSNSDDLGLDELLTDFAQDVALDFTTNDPLDLTVSGRSLKAPNWWGDNFTFGDQSELIAAAETATVGAPYNNSGLHTPVHQPAAFETDSLGWETHDLSAFDVDNLFDIDNLPDPVL